MGIFARKSKRGPLGTRIHFSWARRRPWWLSIIPRVSISAGPR